MPDQACSVHKPLSLSSWSEALGGHPNQPLVRFFLNGIAEGFKIGHEYGLVPLKPAQQRTPAQETSD